MRTAEESQIRNVIATPAAQNAVSWVCQPADYQTPDRICGVFKKRRLKPFDAKCPIGNAKILWDMG